MGESEQVSPQQAMSDIDWVLTGTRRFCERHA
jgi:hypothetical protein